MPFHYYGATDGTDQKTLNKSRGGYETGDLGNLYISSSAAEKRAQSIINIISRYAGNPREMKYPRISVSSKHAWFMAD